MNVFFRRWRPFRLCRVSLVSVSVLLLFSNSIPNLLQAQEHIPAEVEFDGNKPFVAGELLIQFKEEATDAQLADAIRQAAVGLTRVVQTPVMLERNHPGLNVAITRMPVLQAVKLLNRHPAVAFAEPNWVVTRQATANEPYFSGGSLWGMCGDRSSPVNMFGSQAAEAWAANHTGSKSVCVGVIDDGVQISHPDLAANIWVNPYDPVDGLDNDGNGYVDDVNGWNFADRNNAVANKSGDSHGTHVAGTIGAVGGNGQGVAGVNWAVSMIPAKFLVAGSGTIENAIKAVDYYTNLKTRKGVNVVAVNCSWGGSGYSQGLHDAMLRAAKAGILIVVAAGNGDANGNGINTDVSPDYPACLDTTRGTSTESAAPYDAVISVAAIDSGGTKPQWSNYGATSVDIGAPGAWILSTVPNSTYAYSSGTSMAAPHVTGAVALYASTHPNASAAQIKTALLGAAAPTPSLAGITRTSGRLDLSAVILPDAPTTSPLAPPSGVIAVTGDARISLKWNAAAGASSYKVKRSKTDGGPHSVIATTTGNAHTDSGLVNGRTYYYVISAVYPAGESPDSSQVYGTPGTSDSSTPPPPPPAPAPSAPSNLTASAGNMYVALQWTAVAGATSYNVKRSKINGGPHSTIARVTTASHKDTGLVNGRTYYYVVSANTSEGETTNSNQAYGTPAP